MEDPIKYKIKNSHYYKFGGIAPDGFTLIPNETLKRFEDFDNWKEFKYDSNYIEEKNIEKVLSKDFEDGKI